ncbi:FAD/NAD(P)-binding domain-containing protein [Sodiomyces alkalinus F11]|uniref:FAD/NAD(P)-binding domain-containing protein n=1 Tax=Sodiomyces alkalinus (strain CBS 110278 / VKM F-3762 / F11) TaxID=1314773 RepID=A0A3N2PSY7_SODAK|nr:FAD/NAD(P)-binding domain-containing protein [Sodiomyces alkalinus F11]ROT37639.1 FAD/NAD(P)-binding domain-containing protein [Sodiomyces alkalinus F11]
MEQDKGVRFTPPPPQANLASTEKTSGEVAAVGLSRLRPTGCFGEICPSNMAIDDAAQIRIAICGAGISGLALAAFLANLDHESQLSVDLYESSEEVRMSGAGIAVWKRYWDLLRDELGFEHACVDLGFSAPDWTQVKGPVVRKSDTAGAEGHHFCALSHGPTVIPRSAMSSIFAGKLDPSRCGLHLRRRLAHYDETTAPDGRTTTVLRFEDGTKAECDLLVGADGVFSRVRRVLFRDQPDLARHHFSGQLAYRMSCNAEAVQRLRAAKSDHAALRGFTIWSGRGKHVTSNLVGDQIQMSAWDNVSEEVLSAWSDTKVCDVPRESVSHLFRSWEPDLVSLLNHAGDTASRWPIYVAARLPRFVKGGHVALVGDAAHGMTPHQGLGGGQGIEDAFVLASLLTHPDARRGVLPDVLATYDEVRRPASQRVADQSLANGHNFAFLGSSGNGDHPCLTTIRQELVTACDWLMDDDGNCKGEADKARALLETRLRSGHGHGLFDATR